MLADVLSVILAFSSSWYWSGITRITAVDFDPEINYGYAWEIEGYSGDE